MTERGMIFNGEMVRAILDGRKTQTRRIMKVQPRPHDHQSYNVTWKNEPPAYYSLHDTEGVEWACKFCGDGVGMDGRSIYRCPFGKVGDRIWVRETSGLQVRRDALGGTGEFRVYRASAPDAVRYTTAEGKDVPIKWIPSIHMPRWASRILLEITDVRVERLNDISEEDAEAEGLESTNFTGFGDEPGMPNVHEPDVYRGTKEHGWTECPSEAFQHLWESIYGNSSWQANPWVWVIEFKRIEGGAK